MHSTASRCLNPSSAGAGPGRSQQLRAAARRIFVLTPPTDDATSPPQSSPQAPLAEVGEPFARLRWLALLPGLGDGESTCLRRPTPRAGRRNHCAVSALQHKNIVAPQARILGVSWAASRCGGSPERTASVEPAASRLGSRSRSELPGHCYRVRTASRADSDEEVSVGSASPRLRPPLGPAPS
jgi:hypothetical protein